MISIDAVLGWPLDALASAASTYATAGESVASTADSLRRSFDIDPTWFGRTREAAEQRVSASTTRLQRLAEMLVEVAETSRSGQGRILAIQDRLRSQLRTAHDNGFNVDDDGAVAHPEPKRRFDADYLTDRIRGILGEAEFADASLSMALTLLTRRLDGTGNLVPTPNGGYQSADDAAHALTRLTPDDVARYWDTLTEAQRTNLITTAPEIIGNLTGVGFDDRARANRLSIQAAIEAEVARGRGDGEKAQSLRRLLGAAPDPNDPSRLVPRTILGFHDGDVVRYIEMVGSLTAESSGVAVLVPGTGSGLHSAESYRQRAARISHASGAPVIVYVDGEFPQKIIDADLSPIAKTAADPSAARDIAPRLVDFMRGVDTEIAARGLATPTTVIGHSYGGSIVGTAEQSGLRADRVVYASSAGTGVLDGPWQNPNPGVERYSMTAPGDPIHYAQEYGSSVHGGDPDTAPGVTRLDTGRYSNGELVAGSGAHAGYLDDEGSDALQNLAAVIAGGEPTPWVARGPDIDIRGDGRRLLNGLTEGALRWMLPTG